MAEADPGISNPDSLKIVVKNIPEEFDVDHLTDLFESEEYSTGEIDDIVLHDGIATITFKDLEDVQKLLDKRKVVSDNHILKVRKFKTPLKNVETKDVLLQGVTESLTENRLKLYFGNKKRGGQIDSIVLRPCNQTAIIKFQHLKDAQKIVNKETFNVSGNIIKTKFYVPGPEDTLPNRKVYITGVTEDIDEDALMDIIDNMDDIEGDLDIDSFEYIPEKQAAIVIFESIEGVQSFIKQAEFEDSDIHLKICSYSDATVEPTETPVYKSVRVTGLPSNCLSKDKLQNLFQSKKIKAGPIDSVSVDEAHNSAIVSFVNKEDAERMVKSSTVDVKGSLVNIDWFLNDDADKDTSATATDTIIVEDISDLDEDDLENLFENESQTGGGEIEKVTIDGNRAVIKFKDNKVAQRVLKKETIEMDGKVLTTKPYNALHSPTSLNKVLIMGLDDGLAQKLKLFLENPKRIKGGPVKNIIGSENGNIIVEFVNSGDAARIVNINEFTFKNKTLRASWHTGEDESQHNSAPSINNRAIIVDGLQGSIDEEQLENLFENQKRSGGGNIESVKISADQASAEIVFEDESVRKRVLKKGKITYNEKTFTIKEPQTVSVDENDNSTLEVTNIKSNISKDMLSLFFESKKKSGGGDIMDVSYSQNEGRAIIRFKNAKDAAMVLKTHTDNPLKLEDRPVRIQSLDPKKLGKHAFSVNSCAVELSELPHDTNIEELQDTLMMLFENTNMTGGGRTEDVYVAEDFSRAVITFHTPQVAENVIAKHNGQPIYLDDNKLKVKLLSCPSSVPQLDTEMEDSMLLLLNIAEDIESEDIVACMENIANSSVENVIYGLDTGKCLINFHQVPEYDLIFDHFRIKPLKGNMVSCERIEKSRTIEVYGIDSPKNLSMQKLRLYFENRKSNGGPVDHVDKNELHQCAVLTFKNPEDAQRVLNQSKHVIEQQVLTLKLHHKCIGVLPTSHDSTQPVSTIPQELVMDIPCQKKIVYILQSNAAKKNIAEDLKKVHALLLWDKVIDDSVQMTFCCLLTKKVSGYQSLSRSWEKMVRETTENIFHKISVEEIKIPAQTSNELKKYVQESNNCGTESVILILSSGNDSIFIVGCPEAVKQFQMQIQKKISEEERKNERKAKIETRPSPDIAIHHLRYLEKIDYKSALEKRFNDLSITINIQQKAVNITGVPEDIAIAENDILRLIQKLKTKMEAFTPEMADIYNKRSVQEYINTSLKSKGLGNIYFEIGKESVTVFGDDEKIIGTAVGVVLKCISDQNLALGEDSAPMLNSDHWRDFRKKLGAKYGELINLIEIKSAIRILCTDNILDEVYTALVDFFKTNTIKEHFVAVKVGIVKLLQNSDRLQQICQKQASNSVKLQAIMDRNQCGISIKGTEDGLKATMDEVTTLCQRVLKKSHKVTQPGMPAYFLHERGGKQALISLENAHQVAIEASELIDGEDEDVDFGFDFLDSVGLPGTLTSQATVLATVHTDKGITVQVIKDDICKHRADTVLVPATRQLQHIKGIGKTIMDTAGDLVKKECENHIARGGPLIVSEIRVTTSGMIPCHNLLHAVLPGGGPGIDTKEETELYETFYKCFKAVNKLGLRNIVIPGSIIEDYPVDISSKFLADAIKDYSSKFTTTTLKEINLIVDGSTSIFSLQKLLTLLNPVSAATDFTDIGGQQMGAVPKVYKPNDGIKHYGRIKIKLIKDVIDTQKADVIVNTTSSDLQLKNGAVSKSLLKKGGDILQKECDKISAAGYKPGQVADTTGGKLKCKRVYHGSCENYNNGDQNSITILKTFIQTCLEKAHSAKMTSIAFPAVGTGNLGFPRDFVAKTMLDIIANFSKSSPKTTLTDVRLVVYDKDIQTVQAFETALKDCASNVPPVNPSVKSKSTPDVKPKLKGKDSKRGSRALADTLNPKSKASSTVTGGTSTITVGSITIKVTQGDLTKESTDVIVNSTGHDLKFNSQVSKAILKAGGDSIEKECKQIGFMKDHIAMTGAGKLKCKKIFHIDAPSYDPTSWKVRILQCLKMAENNQLKSISFPALGTGALKISPARMAETIMDATADFSSKEKPKYLTSIRIVIYQSAMVSEFESELNRIADSDIGKKKGFLRTALDYIWGSHDTSRPMSRRFTSYVDQSDASDDDTFEENDVDQSVNILQGVVLHIYGFVFENIEKVIEEVTKCCLEEFEDKVIGKDPLDAEVIKNLDNDQVKRIKDLQQKHQVTIKINRGEKLNRITIQGRPKYSADAYINVKAILDEANKKEARLREEKELLEKVKWQFFEDDKEDFEDYPPDINYLIEEAHKSGKPFSTWDETNGQYRIDFQEMQEYPVGDKEQGDNVRRHAPGLIQQPETWTPMDGKEHYMAIDLTPTDLEYEQVIQKISESMESKSYLNEIVSIKRIQNPRVYTAYMSNKNHVQMANPSIKNVERELWHGTSAEAIGEINSTGFNRSFCGVNGTVWGQGVYFARDATYSHSYTNGAADGTRTMYLCRVIVGDFCKGSSAYKVPPTKDMKNEATTRKYDSVVDNPTDPKIFVVFYDALAYPEFLITYK